jgi:hypothetical protein
MASTHRDDGLDATAAPQGDPLPPALLVADALLEIAVRPHVAGLTVEPAGDGSYELAAEGTDGSTVGSGALPAEHADAVIARLALLARIDLATRGERARRLPVRVSDAQVELLVIVNTRRRGLALELRRLRYQGDGPRRPRTLPEDWRPPAQIGGYRIEAQLGRGGMGVVFRAEHVRLGKRFALKIFPRKDASSEEHLARFVNEARAAGRTQHPGIVSVTDCGTTADGLPYLVMELVEWPTLASLLKRGPLEPARAFEIARHIADPLHAVHEQGIVHRDLKPANVFVGPNDAVKICDFGTAKLLEGPAALLSDTQRGVYYGTPHYMAPERACGVPSDRRADVYGLGCVLFEMLTGSVPYLGQSAFETLVSHASAPIPTASSPFRALPPVVQKTLARALAKRPADRYQTAGELASDLERCALALWRKGWRAWLPT